MTIVVTGATGNVGRPLVAELVAADVGAPQSFAMDRSGNYAAVASIDGNDFHA